MAWITIGSSFQAPRLIIGIPLGHLRLVDQGWDIPLAVHGICTDCSREVQDLFHAVVQQLLYLLRRLGLFELHPGQAQVLGAIAVFFEQLEHGFSEAYLLLGFRGPLHVPLVRLPMAYQQDPHLGLGCIADVGVGSLDEHALQGLGIVHRAGEDQRYPKPLLHIQGLNQLFSLRSVVGDGQEHFADHDPAGPFVEGLDDRGVWSGIVVQKAVVELGRHVALGPEGFLQAIHHLDVHPAVIAPAHLEVLAPELVRKQRSRHQRHESDALLVKLVELVDPADGVIGFRFSMGKVDDRRMSETRVACGSCQFGNGPRIFSGQEGPGRDQIAGRELAPGPEGLPPVVSFP